MLRSTLFLKMKAKMEAMEIQGLLEFKELLDLMEVFNQEKMELLDHLERASLVNMDIKVLREQRMIKQRILFLIKVKWIRSEKGKLILGQIIL